jgi:hypothetical protein
VTTDGFLKSLTKLRPRVIGVIARFAIIFPMCLTFCAFLQIEGFCIMIAYANGFQTFAACHFAWMLVPEAIIWVNRDNGWVIIPIALIALMIATWFTVRRRLGGKSWP